VTEMDNAENYASVMEYSNMQTLARIDESAQECEMELKQSTSLNALKQQIARVREAIAKLEEVIR
jgi:hypothetical protein